DRLTTTQTDTTRIQTIYQPGTFAPLIRIETATSELTKAIRRTLAEKLQQDADMVFAPELVTMLDNLEQELQTGQLSEHSQQWLAGCGLTPEQMKNQMEPEYTPARKLHLYHCDHRGLPLALIREDGSLAWQAEFDEWGNLLHEENPENLQQLIRLPGQQYDAESGLYYNRHRYYDPRQGRYITQDPIGLSGGSNGYVYPLDPVNRQDPLGLFAIPLPPIPVPGVSNPSSELNDSAAKALTKWFNKTFSDTEEEECPPCSPPAGEMFNKVTHYEKHGRDPDPLEGSHGCMAKTGSPVHWHYDVNRQIPKTCECKHAKHVFGGCGVAP
ncbi:RHS repeat-associated core domain-containing protein, partial [Lelliottia wanjuensis]